MDLAFRPRSRILDTKLFANFTNTTYDCKFGKRHKSQEKNRKYRTTLRYVEPSQRHNREDLSEGDGVSGGRDPRVSRDHTSRLSTKLQGRSNSLGRHIPKHRENEEIFGSTNRLTSTEKFQTSQLNTQVTHPLSHVFH